MLFREQAEGCIFDAAASVFLFAHSLEVSRLHSGGASGESLTMHTINVTACLFPSLSRGRTLALSAATPEQDKTLADGENGKSPVRITDVAPKQRYQNPKP